MKNSQKAGIIVLAVLLGIVLVLGTTIYSQKTKTINVLQAEKQSINTELQARDSMVNELMTDFNDIEKNLKFIKEKRKQLSIENKQEGGRSRKQAIIDDINLMNEMLEKSSRHIAKLEKKLRNSGFRINSFKKKIESLNKNIEEQNAEIAMLHQQIQEKDKMLANLNLRVDSIDFALDQKTDTLQQQKQIIERKINEQNKAFFTYGTYKELAENGVLIKEGGFLGIGKSTSIQNNLNSDYFTELDIRETKTIPIHSKKAKLISEHPDDSYAFVEENGEIASLEITNPAEFWKISKYAVVSVK